MNKSIELLEREIVPTENMSSGVLRERAKTIAAIGLDHFKDELLDRCLNISAAIASFADELDDPAQDEKGP